MDLRHLKLFCLVVDLHSFSLAAEEVHITQPAASLQIRSLERELGTRVLDRSSREIIPTDAGEVLYRYAKQILELDEQSRIEIGNLGDLLGGRITVGSSTGPGEHILPTLIARFREQWPRVEISLRVTDTSEVIDRVLDRELEVGVVGALAHSKELVARPLARDEIVFICAPDHPWAARGEVGFDEFLREPLIVQQTGAGIRAVFDDNLRQRGIRPTELNIVLEMGLNESAKHAVMAGAGVSYMSKFAVRTEVEHKTLAVVRVKDFRILRDFYFVHSRHKVLSSAAQAFLEYLGEQYDKLD
jgi:DNA-binding transcriptional LysR family regulator